MLACRSVNRPKTRGTLAIEEFSVIAQSLTTHASTQPAIGAAKFSPLELQILSLIDRWRHQRDRHRGDCLIWF